MPFGVFDNRPQSPRRIRRFTDNFPARFNHPRERQPDIRHLEAQPQFKRRFRTGPHGIDLKDRASVFAREMLRTGPMAMPDKRQP